MSLVQTIDTEGRVGVGPVIDAEGSDALGAYERARLLDQNIVRRVEERSPWNVIADPFSPSTTYPIELITASSGLLLNGDAWDDLNHRFVSEVPAAYNMKALFEGMISLPAAAALKISRVSLWYIVNDGTAQPFGKNHAHLSAAATKTWIYAWSITGADTIQLDAGDTVRLAWSFDGLADITYLEEFYARLVIEKVADLYAIDTECCNG